MATVTKTCECGRTVEVEVPDTLKGTWRDMLIRMGVSCQACEDAKLAERNAYEQELAGRETRRLLDRRRKQCRIPELLRDLAWASVDTNGRHGAVDSARRWSEGQQRGLLLTGEIGVGKTYLAATAAWHYLSRGSLRWTSAPALMTALAAGWDDQRRRDALSVLTSADALVLDDLDKTRPSEYAAEQLFGAIDTRVTRGVPLLVTTNLSLNELADRFPSPFGDSIASRLAGYCETRTLAGADRRMRKLVSVG